MTAVLLDTHTWAWSFADDAKLSAKAARAIEYASTVYVSPITFFEITQKARIGKWPAMVSYADRLSMMLDEQRGRLAALDAYVCATAGAMRWANRDPFDRILAATARRLDVPIVSADGAFDAVVSRVW